MKRYITIVKLIIEKEINVNQQSDFYDTALQAAVYHGQHDAVELLLDVDANVHAKRYFKNAFHAAVEEEHQDVIMLMLRKNYKFYHLSSSSLYSKARSSSYKILMRDASSERNSDSYRRRQAS